MAFSQRLRPSEAEQSTCEFEPSFQGLMSVIVWILHVSTACGNYRICGSQGSQPVSQVLQGNCLILICLCLPFAECMPCLTKFIFLKSHYMKNFNIPIIITVLTNFCSKGSWLNMFSNYIAVNVGKPFLNSAHDASPIFSPHVTLFSLCQKSFAIWKF